MIPSLSALPPGIVDCTPDLIRPSESEVESKQETSSSDLSGFYANVAKKLIDRGFVWIQSHSGELSVGSGGPPVCRVWEEPPIIGRKIERTALLINAYDENSLLSYIFDCIQSDWEFFTSCYLVNGVDFLETDPGFLPFPGTVFKLPDLSVVGRYRMDTQPWELKFVSDPAEGAESDGKCCFAFSGSPEFDYQYEYGSSKDWFSDVAGGWLVESRSK